MTLFVDFNMRDEAGRVIALLPRAAEAELGDMILAEDEEGNSCKAMIEEIRPASQRGSLVASLQLIPGTWHEGSADEATPSPSR